MSTQSITVDSGPQGAHVVPAKTKRYHPALVALHWLIAILIFGTGLLALENERREQLGEEQNSPQPVLQQEVPTQPESLQGDVPPQDGSENIFSMTGIHMIVGIAILVLLAIRLLIRRITRHPDWASTGNKFFDRVGTLTHLGLYVLTFSITITGIILASRRGMLADVLGIGTPIPGGIRRGAFPFGYLHEWSWILLLLLLALHIGAALYHQFILKDNLLSRMWFGKQIE
ncbi:MAG TPA: cytochrome b/b6 domain-containing protein [Anaerolineales bacterium]|nr:cytochrome b/b6 domain-containing protein [Anaerolineales bacterium]